MSKRKKKSLFIYFTILIIKYKTKTENKWKYKFLNLNINKLNKLKQGLWCIIMVHYIYACMHGHLKLRLETPMLGDLNLSLIVSNCWQN